MREMIDYKNNYSEKKNYFVKWGGVKSVLKFCNGEVPDKVDISICIPTFNRVEELAKAVQSVNLQEKTRLVWNLIIVDNELSELDGDSPKRKLLEAVEGISLKYYQNEKNIGLFGNWNRCIELADGNWVSMLHDDDLIDSDYLKTIESIIANIDYKSVAYIKTGARTEESTFKSKKDCIRLKYRSRLVRYRMSDVELLGPASIGILGAPSCGTLINRQIFVKAGGYNEEHYPCEDAYMPVKLINLYGYKVYRTVGNLGTYQWNDNVSYKKETLMGDARELNSYLEYYRRWGKIAKCCFKLFRNEIIWMAYGGMENLVRESKYIVDKEALLHELQDTIGMPKKRKIHMKIYIFFKRLHSWILIGRGIIFGRNYAKNKKVLSIYQNSPASLKAGIWFTFCNLLLKGISLISLPLFTRMLSTGEYGMLTLYASTQQILVIIATWDLGYGAFQKGLFKYKEEEIGHLNGSTVLFCNIVTVIVFGIMFLCYDLVSRWLLFPKRLLFLLMLFTIFQPAYRNWTLQKQKNYQYKPVVVTTLLISVGNVLGAYLAVRWVGRTADVKYGAELLFFCVVTGIFWVGSLHIRQVFGNVERTLGHIKFIVGFQAPCVLHSLSLLVLGQADRLMIGHMVGKSQAAFYGIAYNLASAITIFQSSLEVVMIPWRYRKLEGGYYDKISRNSNTLLFFVGCFICLFILVAPEAMALLFTEEYQEAVWSIPPIALSVYFIFLYSIFTSIETYYEKTKYIMYVSVGCSALNIVLNYLLIDLFGYIVCGYTTLFSYICFAIGHYYFMCRVCKEKIAGIPIFSAKKILVLSIFFTAFTVIVTIIYPYAFLRYLILLALILAVVIFRDRIRGYIEYVWKDVRKKE